MVEKKVKKYRVVIGALFGDEGKGRTVDYLCENAARDNKKVVVIRYSGGPQAGHSVDANGIHHIFSSLGSGTLQGADTYLDRMFYFDPISYMMEYEDLSNKLQSIEKELNTKTWIHNFCRIITPYDVMYGRNDSVNKDHGTCGKGIYPTYKRCLRMNGVGSKISILSKEFTLEHIFDHPQEYLDSVKRYYVDNLNDMVDEKQIDFYDKMFIDAIDYIKKLIEKDLFKIRGEDFARSGLYDEIIYEGSQGLLLDMESGFMPHCTPSKVGLNGIPSYVTDDPETEVYLVVRSYLTRHGNGYVPEDHDRNYLRDEDIFRLQSMINLCHESAELKEINIDGGWQGKFKVGAFDLELLNRAIDRHRLDNYHNVKFNLVITHMDLLTDFIDAYGYYPVHEYYYYNTEIGLPLIRCPKDFVYYIKNNLLINIEKAISATDTQTILYDFSL